MNLSQQHNVATNVDVSFSYIIPSRLQPICGTAVNGNFNGFSYHNRGTPTGIKPEKCLDAFKDAAEVARYLEVQKNLDKMSCLDVMEAVRIQQDNAQLLYPVEDYEAAAHATSLSAANYTRCGEKLVPRM